VIGGDDTGAPLEPRGLAGELVLSPPRAVVRDRVVGAFEDQLGALQPYAPESAVGVHQVELIERRIHHLAGRQEIRQGTDTEVGHHHQESGRGDLLKAVKAGRPALRVPGRFREAPWQQASPEGIVEAGERGNDGEPVQESQVPADDEEDLKGDEQQAGDVPELPRTEHEERRHELAEIVVERAELVEPERHEVEERAHRIGDGLGLVVIGEAGEVPPTRIAAELDETRPEHDPEDEEPEEPDRNRGRRTTRKRPSIEERAEEDREKTRLEKLDLPAELVPDLAHVDDRKIEKPKKK
jgi:hypothetical protein